MGAAFERRDGTAQAPMPFWARRDKAVWGGLARHLSFWILIEIVIAFVFHFMGVIMRRILTRSWLVAASLAVLVSTPAAALGIGDLAKVVLGNSSVLKKGEEKCGTSLGLTKDDSLAMTFARGAVEKSLPISQFLYLDKAAENEASTTSSTPTFCKDTKAKKSGLMKSITKAGKAILKQKALGSLGL